MKSNRKRLLALLLVLTMLLSMMPAVFAEEETPADPEQEELLLPEEPAVNEDPVDPEVPGDTAEPGEEPGDPTEPGEEPGTEPETPADPEPEDPAEEPEAEEEAEEEEEEPVELPYGFPGMGEDYELSEAEAAAKLAIAGLPESLAALVPGVDYVEGELLLMTDSADYAQLAADAYDADLAGFAGSYALLQLRSATVLQAVECAADPDLPLPAVEPVYLSANAAVTASAGDFGVQGERMSWDDWEWDIDLNPWLDPFNPNYQYHHDLLQDYAAWGVTNGSGAKVTIISFDKAAALAALINDGIDDGVDGVGVAYGADVSTVTPAADTSVAFADSVTAAASSGGIILVDAAFPGNNTVLTDAVNAALNSGCVVIAPMGDGGSNRMCWPAAVSGVISVAATDATGSLAGFSNFGAWCYISAPGSALNFEPTCSGTSYAAALVAGAAALYAGRFQNYSGVAAALKKAVVKGGAGAGVVNTAKLFGGAPEKPAVVEYGAAVSSVKGTLYSLSEDGWFRLGIPAGLSEDLNPTIYYTLNGAKPAMKNGLIANDSMLEPDDEGKIHIAATPNLKLGKTYTIKAIAVNGLGVPSKIASVKFKLVGIDEAVSVKILNAPGRLVAGKSFTLLADAVNDNLNAVNQKFTWSIAEQTDGLGAKISATSGKLTTKAGKAGTVKVLCKHNDSGAEDTCTIEIAVVPPVAKVLINDGAKAITLWTHPTTQTPVTLTLTAKDGSPIAAEDAGVRWTSSNEKVAIVAEEEGVLCLIPMAVGTATVKAAVLDGSGKSASVKVTVKQRPIFVVASTKNGATVLSPGCTINLVGTVYPASASDKSVVWEFENISQFGSMLTVNAEKGTLKLNKNYVAHGNEDEIITAVAISTLDSSVRSEPISIPVRPKVTSLEVQKPSNPNYYNEIYDNNGNLKSITLLTRDMPTDVPGAHDADESVCSLLFSEHYGTAMGKTSDMITATIKDTSIAYTRFDEENNWWEVVAVKPGKTTLTVQSGDATKKHTTTVTVLSPMSTVIVESAAPGKSNTVACGKSIKLKGVAIDSYGKPSNNKLEWTLVEVFDSNGTALYEFKDLAHYKDSIGIKKYVTVNPSSGVVKVTAAAANYHIEKIVVRVRPASYPKALETEYTVYAAPPVKTITVDAQAKNLVLTESNPEAEVGFVASDMHGAVVRNTEVENLFSVTSSKPALVGAMLVCSDDYSSCKVQLSVPDLSKLPAKAQSVKITIKANDGSGKSASFTIKVSK